MALSLLSPFSPDAKKAAFRQLSAWSKKDVSIRADAESIAQYLEAKKETMANVDLDPAEFWLFQQNNNKHKLPGATQLRISKGCRGSARSSKRAAGDALKASPPKRLKEPVSAGGRPRGKPAAVAKTADEDDDTDPEEFWRSCIEADEDAEAPAASPSPVPAPAPAPSPARAPVLPAVPSLGDGWAERVHRQAVACVSQGRWYCGDTSVPDYLSYLLELYIDHVEELLLSAQGRGDGETNEFPEHVSRFFSFVERALLNGKGCFCVLEHFAGSWRRLQSLTPKLTTPVSVAKIRMAEHPFSQNAGFDLKFLPPSLRPLISESRLFKDFDEACVRERVAALQSKDCGADSATKYRELLGLSGHDVGAKLKQEVQMGKVWYATEGMSGKVAHLLTAAENFEYLAKWAGPDHSFLSLRSFVTGDFAKATAKTFMRDVKTIGKFEVPTELIKCPVARALVCDWPQFRDVSGADCFGEGVFLELASRKLGFSSGVAPLDDKHISCVGGDAPQDDKHFSDALASLGKLASKHFKKYREEAKEGTFLAELGKRLERRESLARAGEAKGGSSLKEAGVGSAGGAAQVVGSGEAAVQEGAKQQAARELKVGDIVITSAGLEKAKFDGMEAEVMSLQGKSRVVVKLLEGPMSGKSKPFAPEKVRFKGIASSAGAAPLIAPAGKEASASEVAKAVVQADSAALADKILGAAACT